LTIPNVLLPFSRVSDPAAEANAPREAGSLPANSSAKAALLPFTSLFAEICHEELVQVKRLLSEMGCAWWKGFGGRGNALSGRRSFENIFINLV
jgi:hypothetical protein